MIHMERLVLFSLKNNKLEMCPKDTDVPTWKA